LGNQQGIYFLRSQGTLVLRVTEDIEWLQAGPKLKLMYAVHQRQSDMKHAAVQPNLVPQLIGNSGNFSNLSPWAERLAGAA
jgi:hypothetical protein